MKLTEQFIAKMQTMDDIPPRKNISTEAKALLLVAQQCKRNAIAFYELDPETISIMDELLPKQQHSDEIWKLGHNLTDSIPTVYSFNAVNPADKKKRDCHLYTGRVGDTDIFALFFTNESNDNVDVLLITNKDGHGFVTGDSKQERDNVRDGILYQIAAIAVLRDLMMKEIILPVPRVARVRSKVTGAMSGERKYNAITIDLCKYGVIKNKPYVMGQTGATGTGSPKRRHVVESFVRVRNGKAHIVKQHMRGKHIPDAPPLVHRIRGASE
jgi:hypothetical protein